MPIRRRLTSTRVGLTFVAVTVLSVVGCSEPESGANAPVRGEPLICDGTDDIRLTFESGGGMVDQSYAFMHPYGWQFLFVDGKCRYYVADGSGPIRTGQLERALTFEIEAALYFESLANFATDSTECPDAGSRSLASPFARVTCGCSCVNPESTALLTRGNGYVEQLWDSGEERDLELSAARSDVTSTSDPVVWPLSWAITDLANYLEPNNEPNLTGTNIADAADRQTLRQMREAWTAGGNYGAIAVSSSGIVYDLLLRDELPKSVIEGLARFDGLPRVTD